MKRRILALLLACTMLVSMLPVQAFATEGQEEFTHCTTDGCKFEAGHEGNCSNYVEPELCATEGCEYEAGHEGNCSNYIEPAADAAVYVTVSDRGELGMAWEEVTVSDTNADGVLSVDEALYAAHVVYGMGYASEDGVVSVLWGMEAADVSFYVNHVSVTADTALQAGDYVVASVDRGGDYGYDKYSRFDVQEITVSAGDTFCLKLTDDAAMPLAGVELMLWNGVSTVSAGVSTDAGGCAELYFDEPGLYTVSAMGTVTEQAYDEETDTMVDVQAPIIAPACVVVVHEAAGSAPEASAWDTAGITLETGHVAEYISEAYLSKIVLTGVEGTASGTGNSWEIVLAEGTDMTQPISVELTSSALATRKAALYFWADGTVSGKSAADEEPAVMSVLPAWENGQASVIVGVGTSSKVLTAYNLELSVQGAVVEDPYHTEIPVGETKSKKYFAKEFEIDGALVSDFQVSGTDFSGSSSGHTAQIDIHLSEMPEGSFAVTMNTMASGAAYGTLNGGDRAEFDSTYSFEVDLNKATSYTVVTYSTKSSSTVRGTYTINFTVSGGDTNIIPALKGDATGAEAALLVGQTYSLNLAELFTDANGDALTYTLQLNGADPETVAADYTLSPSETGEYTLVFRANDGTATSEDSYTVVLKVSGNTAPYLQGEASASAVVNQYSTWSIDLTQIFADAENNGVTYSVSRDGATAAATASTYRITPDTAGEMTLVFQARDDSGEVSPEYTVTLTVAPAAQRTIGTSCTGSESGDTWLSTVTVTGPEVLAHAWSVESGHLESDPHVLSIQLAADTPDDAEIQLSYVLGYASSLRGGYSGPASLTLSGGKGTATVTTSGWMNYGTPRTYILNFSNKANNAPTVSPSAVTEVSLTTGEVFTLDLSTIFSDPDGDALSYTVTVDGQETAIDTAFSQAVSASGKCEYVFTATDPWRFYATHTVTVTASQSEKTFDVSVLVPEGITPSFYVNGGFDGQNGDLFGDALTAAEGTTENGFTSYTVAVPENVTRISFRGTDAEGINWGGMTAAVSEGMDALTLVKVLGVIPSKVNGSYATAEQALLLLMDKDGNYAVSGSTGTDQYGITNYRFLAVAWGTDNLSNAYTAYLEPQGSLASSYSTSIGNNITFVKSTPQQLIQLALTLKSGYTINVPKDATVQLFQQRNYYNSPEIPVTDKVEKDDGTVDWIFEKGSVAYMSYRATLEGHITKAGYVTDDDGLTITWDDADPAPDCRAEYDPSTTYGARGDDSIMLNVNGRNNLVMNTGGTFRLRGYRIWEVINSDTSNIMIQPDMHYSLTGDSIVSVTPVTSGSGNAKNNWLDLEATGTGVAFLEVGYDALHIVTGNMSSFGGDAIAGFTFNASDPARTGLVVVQVGNWASDVNFGIQSYSLLGNNSVPWDVEYDTLYFTGSSGKLTLNPSVGSGAISEVAVSSDKGGSWTALSAADGAYVADIYPGNNIIRITKTDGTQAYQVVRGDRVTVGITQVTGNGDSLVDPGETYRVQLYGLHNPIGKMSGNYNPGYGQGQHLMYKFNGTTVTTTGTYQYNFVSNASVNVTIPEDAKAGDSFSLNNGFISFNVFGITDFTDDVANHRGVGDSGCGTRGGNATQHQRSLLPEITLTVGRKTDGTDPTVAVTGVSLDQTSLTLAMGDAPVQLNATVSPADATDKTVTWSANPASVVTAVNGLVTPVGPGEATVTVTTADGSFSATCTVTVTQSVESITIPTSLKITEGETATLTATVLPENATDKTVTWTSSDEKIATVDADGKVTAIAAGEATITAKAGDKEDTCAVSVAAKSSEPVSVNVTFTAQANGEFLVSPQLEMTVYSTVAEEFGYKDQTDMATQVSTIDVLVTAHLVKYGTAFTLENANTYLNVDANFITSMFGDGNKGNVCMLVNGLQPGTNEYKLGVEQASVSDGDLVEFFVYQNAAYADKYVWLELADGTKADGQSVYGGKATSVVVKGRSPYSYGYEGDAGDVAISGATIYMVDIATGALTSLDVTTDANGAASILVPEAYVGQTVYLVAKGKEMAMTLAEVKVEQAPPSVACDLASLEIAVGGNTIDTSDVQTLTPEFAGTTTEYTAPVLDYVSDKNDRFVWVKVEAPEGTTVTAKCGSSETATLVSGEWGVLQVQGGYFWSPTYSGPLTPGAYNEVIITVSKEGETDKVYTVTIPMQPDINNRSISWKTNLVDAVYFVKNQDAALAVEAQYVNRPLENQDEITYQWYKNTSASTEGGTAIDGAVSASYSPDVTQTGTSYYYVTASCKDLESITSTVIAVTVTDEAAPTSVKIVCDHPYTIPNTWTMALGGVSYIAKPGDTLQLKAVDENGKETPVVWLNTSINGGTLDKQTGVYTVTNTSYSYVQVASLYDRTIKSEEKVIEVKDYSVNQYNKTPSVTLSTDGQTFPKINTLGGVDSYTIWEYKFSAPNIAELISDLSKKPARLEFTAMRPGTIEASLDLDLDGDGKTDGNGHTDTATLFINGIAVEDASGNLTKTYLEISSAASEPTMQLTALSSTENPEFTWTSADETVATVNENGLVTAKGVGSVIISANDGTYTGGIKVVVSSADTPYFEHIDFTTTNAWGNGLSNTTWKTNNFKATTLAYTGLSLTKAAASSLVLKNTTLYNTEKYTAVATYTAADGTEQSISINSGEATELTNIPFETSTIVITLADKSDAAKKTEYTFEITRPRDTLNTIASNGIVFAPEGREIWKDKYDGKTEGIMYVANEDGSFAQYQGVSSTRMYYRTYAMNGLNAFSLNLKGGSAYTHIRISTDDGATWTYLGQTGASGINSGKITIPQSKDDTHSVVKVMIQILDDKTYAANVAADKDGFADSTPKTYSLWVEQIPELSADCDILTAETDRGDWYPAFTKNRTSYRLIVDPQEEAPVLTFTVSKDAKVSIDGVLQTPNENGAYTVTLTRSAVEIVVAASDGMTEKTYTFGCSERMSDAVPNSVVDYLLINGQYINGGGGAYGINPYQVMTGGLLSLGNFGGYVTLYYEDGLTDSPNHPYGVDFYVNGNAFKDTSTGSGLGSMEPGQVWVSEDGQTWYALAGSEHYEEDTLWDYSVTYSRTETNGTAWTDSEGNTHDSTHGRSFAWPNAEIYNLNDLPTKESFTLTGILLPCVDGTITGKDAFGSLSSGARFGYADTFVNGTNNPYLDNSDYSNASTGFDLAWAVDSHGNPVDVSGKSFHYVKIVTASNIMAGTANEKSTEVAEVVRAAENSIAVGVTTAPSGVVFASGETTYSVELGTSSGICEVTLPEDMTEATVQVSGSAEDDNIYINNQRVASGNASTAFRFSSDTQKLIRIIVQNGEKEPVIYLLKVKNASSVAVEGVSLDQTSLTLAMGDAPVQLNATVSPENATDKTVTWSANPASVATAVNGLVTPVGPGEATVTVTTADGSFSATCTVTVTQSVESITIPTSLKITEGETATLTATVLPENATDKTVTWESSDESIATVNANGKVTGVKAGTATITATTTDGGFAATCTVTVTERSTEEPDDGLGYVTISFEDHGVRVSGESMDEKYRTPLGTIIAPFQVAIEPYDTIAGITMRALEEKGLTYYNQGNAYSDFYLVTIGNFTVNGTYYDAFGEFDAGQGSGWMITHNGTFIRQGASAFTVEDGDVIRWQYTCQLGKDIGDDYIGSDDVAVTGVKLNKTTASMKVGENVTLTATVTPTNATNKTVTWTSSDEKIATVDANGKVTALKSGIATITAKAGDKTATCKVNVSSVAVTGVTLDKTVLSLKVSENATLTATVTPNNASDKTVTWTSSDQAVAKVDENGKVTALKAGTATITAKAGDKSATCTVKVEGEGTFVPVASVTLNKTSLSLKVNGTETLTATVAPAGATDKTVTWESSDETIAKVDENGKITALKAGTATITAKAGDKSATCKVTVTAASSNNSNNGNNSNANDQTSDAVSDVEKLIQALPTTVTKANEEKVLEALDAYDALTDTQKGQVDEKLVEKLEQTKQKLAKAMTTAEEQSTAATVEAMIAGISQPVTLESEDAITAARAAYDGLTDYQKWLVSNLDVLVNAEQQLVKLKLPANVEDVYITTGDYLSQLGTPGVGTTGGEWMVIGLARSGRTVPEGYYDHVLAHVAENINEAQQLHKAKSTDNSRLILALTAIGKDVTDVGGHNLLQGLSDMEYIQKQGINGPIWALIALDSGNYPAPEGTASRAQLIDVILQAQLADGGWALSGETADPDMTGMAIQALAPYREEISAVDTAIDKALALLSRIQNPDGSFSTVDGPNAESIAQVIVALTTLGINPDEDLRFIKNGVSVLDALIPYYVSGGGFRHMLGGNLDGMSTEQGYYALVSYYRLMEGKTSLYDMTDVIDMGGDPVPEETTEPTEAPTEPVEEEKNTSAWIWVTSLVLCAGGAVALILNRKKFFGL